MEQLQNLLNHWKGNGEVILESSCNPADSTMVGASGLAVETFFNSQDSKDETNATSYDALLLDPGISFAAAKLVRAKTKGRPKIKQIFTGRKRKARVPLQYSKLHQEERVKILLSGAVSNFADSDSHEVYDVDAIKPYNEISSCLLDEYVDIACVRSYFGDSAFKLLLSRLEEKKEIWSLCLTYT
ncbi:hypothetical protein RRG08_011079 [Elysia crispata]|uniref:Uncharacterized protein n=1 Tax=Elysia crispata TaxID=231223 RepID=A0AAE0Z8Z2_9GAST|nr:hypothetical protein RRG08_011079 [Elysia crispata]